jgi:hypothetical protein
MGTGDVFLFLGFGFYLVPIGIFPFAASAKGDAILKNQIKVVHNDWIVFNFSIFPSLPYFNGGTDALR